MPTIQSSPMMASRPMSIRGPGSVRAESDVLAQPSAIDLPEPLVSLDQNQPQSEASSRSRARPLGARARRACTVVAGSDETTLPGRWGDHARQFRPGHVIMRT